MNTFIKLIIFLFAFFPLFADQSHYVIVSVAPHKFFVEQIGGETVDVGLIVPAGASAHTFEPSPKQMLAASRADAWFGLGETFESRAVPVVKRQNPQMEFVDLRDGLDLIYDKETCCSCHRGAADPHIWLSPKTAKVQAKTIAEALTRIYPENREYYQNKLNQFSQQLDTLDREVAALLAPMEPRIVMISHPAYGYLARDYGFKQLSIEFEGKDPTPQQLTKVIETARMHKIGTVFTQPQYSSKGAKLIARQLNADVVSLDPYAEDYINSLKEIAHAFAKSQKRSS